MEGVFWGMNGRWGGCKGWKSEVEAMNIDLLEEQILWEKSDQI